MVTTCLDKQRKIVPHLGHQYDLGECINFLSLTTSPWNEAVRRSTLLLADVQTSGP